MCAVFEVALFHTELVREWCFFLISAIGEWHTQLSRQQLRALKQKEKEKVESQQKSVVIEERETDGARRGAVQRSPRGRGTGREVRGEGGGGGKDGGGGRRREAAVVRSRREREGEPKKWNLPNKGETSFPN